MEFIANIVTFEEALDNSARQEEMSGVIRGWLSVPKGLRIKWEESDGNKSHRVRMQKEVKLQGGGKVTNVQ